MYVTPAASICSAHLLDEVIAPLGTHEPFEVGRHQRPPDLARHRAPCADRHRTRAVWPRCTPPRRDRTIHTTAHGRMMCNLHVLRPRNARVASTRMAALGTAVPAADGSGAAQEHELRVLYEIIHTVNSTLDLEQVLGAIVRLVNDAIVAHATYIFLSEDAGGGIVLRAASEHYAHLGGRVSMAAGEGIAGWVLENAQPVFIPEKALADPRIKYFPELEEEKYQSLVSVPLIAKGERVIGVIALHAEAPRVFSPQDARVPAPRRPRSSPTRSRTRGSTSARGARCASSSSCRSSAAHIARGRVGRRPAGGDGRAGARRCSAPSRCASTCSSRAATGCACARPRRAPPDGPDIVSLARAERRAAALAGRRRHAHLGARGHALGRADDALGARRAARRGRRGDGLPRRAAGRRPPRERARARPRQLDRVADGARPQAVAADRAARRAQPHQGSLRRARERARHLGDRGAGTAPRHRRRRARRRRVGTRPRRRAPRRPRPSCRRPRRSRRRRSATSRARSSTAPRTRSALLAPGARRRVRARAHRVDRGGGARSAGGRHLQRLQRTGRMRGRVHRGTAGGARPARPARGRAAPALRRARRLQVPAARPARRARARQARRRPSRPRRARRAGATRSCCRRSRSSCASAATWARLRRRCTSIPTRCASGCAGSRSSRASTRATPTGSLLEVALKLQRLEEVYPPGHHT